MMDPKIDNYLNRNLGWLVLASVVLSFIMGFGFGYWVNNDSVPTPEPNPCASFPPPPQCIPTGFVIMAPDGTTYTNGVTPPK
jgi:hypothetical protein